MTEHRRIAAFLLIAKGVLGLFTSVAGFTVAKNLARIDWASRDGSIFTPQLLVKSFEIGAVLSVLFGVPAIIAGAALLSHRPWARRLGLLASALQLVSFPVGTFIGSYGIWALISQPTRESVEARLAPVLRF